MQVHLLEVYLMRNLLILGFDFSRAMKTCRYKWTVVIPRLHSLAFTVRTLQGRLGKTDSNIYRKQMNQGTSYLPILLRNVEVGVQIVRHSPTLCDSILYALWCQDSRVVGSGFLESVDGPVQRLLEALH